jgi:hypothetical protein
MTDSYNPAVGYVHGDFPAAPRGNAIAALFAALQEGDGASRRYLLLLRFTVVNLVALALFGAAWFKGWVAMILAGDSTHLVVLIAGVFAYGLVRCAGKIYSASMELNQLRELPLSGPSQLRSYLDNIRGHDAQSRAINAAALKMRLLSEIGSVRHIANSLVFLGLLGTVIGFIMALSGVDADTAGDVKSIAPMVTTLIDGMSVALYTTLVGAVLNIWLMLNYRLLEGGTVALLTGIVERGERHVRA